MLRQSIIRASRRNYVIAAKKPALKTTTVKKTSTISTPPPAVEEPEEAFFDVSELGLQSGQSARPKISSSTTASGISGQTLSQKFPKTFNDLPKTSESLATHNEIHWPTSYYGLGAEPFPEKAQTVLAEPIEAKDIEIKPDGLIYLPEIKYRRVLNKAFGAGGWGLIARSETIITDKLITREYALVCLGRLVSIARGEQDYFSTDGIPTATEGCRSNALMRCCKDLGIASELWDPGFIRSFKAAHCEEKFVEHATTKRKRKLWKRKDRTFEYPYKVV